MEKILHYLTLPLRYTQGLGGVRWSTEENALVYPDEGIFAFHEEIALFLEGFAQSRAPIPLAHIVHLLDLFRHTRRTVTPELVRLRELFYENGAYLRNAGAFFGVICREVPGLPQPVDVAEVCARLRDPAMPLRWFAALHHTAADATPWPLPVFERHVLDRLAQVSPEEIAHWFHDGCAPQQQAGEQLAERMPEPPPRTLTGLTEKLLTEPRLVGAVPYLTQMVSALTLPPRRLDPTALPIGGYSDVTTQGRPDQMLLSQFALDDWDFFRRFAEKELLYFRREEPQSSMKEELIVVLDQGMRTWGEVRLMLTAAALALARLAERRKLTFFLAATSNHGRLVDPLALAEEDLKELLQASDFTPHPALALESALERVATPVGWATPTTDHASKVAAARDIVLLTHPRCLTEPDVAAAARRATEAARLFSLSVDAVGRASWCQWKHGGPTERRTFLVDQSQPAPHLQSRDKTAAEPWTAWTGDVEPIGFPFRFGVGQHIKANLIEFDYGSEWLLTGARQGMLYVWSLDGQRREVLPRPIWDNKLATNFMAVFGVLAGFVVIEYRKGKYTAFHYDLVRRHCRGYPLPCTVPPLCRYSAEHHTIVFWDRSGHHYAIDLTLGICYPPAGDYTGRAAEAVAAVQRFELPARDLALYPQQRGNPPPAEPRASLCWDQETGVLTVWPSNASKPWPEFTPLADGKPIYGTMSRDCDGIQMVQCAGNVLAALSLKLGRKHLRLLVGPGGSILTEYALSNPKYGFVLSHDAKFVALQTQDCVICVDAVGCSGQPQLVTKAGGYPSQVHLQLERNRLVISTGKHGHILEWSGGQLYCTHMVKHVAEQQNHKKVWVRRLLYDKYRFRHGIQQGLTAVVDQFGLVLLFDKEENLLCMFFAFRQDLAGWMPDGTCFGPPSLTGRTATPGWERRFAKVLQAASKGMIP